MRIPRGVEGGWRSRQTQFLEPVLHGALTAVKWKPGLLEKVQLGMKGSEVVVNINKRINNVSRPKLWLEFPDAPRQLGCSLRANRWKRI